MFSAQKSLGKSKLKAFSSSTNLVSILSKTFSATIIGATILSTGMFSQTTAIADTAKNSNPEAILSLEFSNGTELKTVVDQIKNNLPNKNLNSIDIISIGSVIDFGTGTQTFVKSNDEQVKSSKFVDEFKKNQVAFLKTLEVFKEADSKGQNYEAKDQVKPLVDKYSKKDLAKTKQNIKDKNTAVSSMAIVGQKTTLENLKIKLSVKSSYITDLAEIQRQTQGIKAKVEKETTLEGKLKITKEEVAKLLSKDSDKNPEIKTLVANAPKLESLSQEKIQAIDSLITKDPSGNNFVDSTKLKKDLKLSDVEVKEVQKAMTNYNNLPKEIKDGSNSAVQSVTSTETIKEAVKNEATSVEKLGAFVSGLGSVKTEAQSCVVSTRVIYRGAFKWTGTAWMGLWINDCATKKIVYGLEATTVAYTFAGTLCALIASCTFGAVIGIVTSVVYAYGFILKSMNDNCNNRGVNFHAGLSMVPRGAYITPWMVC
jgi:hypothetical protein